MTDRASVAALLKQAGHEIESTVRGSSMTPALPDGSRVRVRCGPAPLSPGQIVAILADPLISHRVVSCPVHRSHPFVITRGDAQWFCDLPVRQDQLLGVVVACDLGDGWGAPPNREPIGPIARLLGWCSHTAMRAALAVSEGCASWVARAGASVATRHAVRR